MATNDQRSYVASKFAFDLGGQTAGWISSIEGGQASSEVVVEKVGPDIEQHKHLSGLKFEDITITCGTSMQRQFYSWIQNSLDRKLERRDGAIITADFNFKEVNRMNFHQALITEIGFPALDASSKEPAKMTIKFAVESTDISAKTGSALQGAQLGSSVQKKWLPSNFRLEVQGCEENCKWVNKVDAITIKQKVVEVAVGEHRTYQKEPANIEFPNLAITLSESHADNFYEWYKSFVIQGLNDESQERHGTLQYLASDAKTVLFSLEFFNLGIFKMTPEKVESGSENIRRVKVEMYCQRIKFDPGPGLYA